jgi:multiple antibiotic resistance protein
MDIEPWSEYAKFFAGLVAVVNPVGAVPIFVNMTVNQTPAERARTGFTATISTATILFVALLTGEAILKFFGITIASFRVSAGILIMLIAISMLHAKVSPTKHTVEEAEDSAERESVAVVPLGTPLLAGPGAISTVIVFAQRHASLLHYAILAIEIVLVAATILICFRAAPYLARLLGRTGINVFTRIMGLIMAAIGVEFIAIGLKQLFPALS